MWQRRMIKRRLQAGLLSLCMIFTILFGDIGVIAIGQTNLSGYYISGLCEHHPVHTEDCGYVEAVEGQPCTHVHDENCGYAEGTCTHEHDASCYVLECVHVHTEECYSDFMPPVGEETVEAPAPEESFSIDEENPAQGEETEAAPAEEETTEEEPDAAPVEEETVEAEETETVSSEGIEIIEVDVFSAKETTEAEETEETEAAPVEEETIEVEETEAAPVEETTNEAEETEAPSVEETTEPEETEVPSVEESDADACEHEHGEECYVLSCNHEHDEACVFVDSAPCTHEHDEDCGYVKAVAGHPCEYVCEICSKREGINWIITPSALHYDVVGDKALHFVIRHWHTSSEYIEAQFQGESNDDFVVAEGYIVPLEESDKRYEKGVTEYAFYFVYQNDTADGSHKAGDLALIDPGKIESAYIESVDAAQGIIILKANPYADAKEKFSGFSISGGHNAVVEGDENITITYSKYVHLVKGHAFYIRNLMDVDGTVNEAVFGTDEEGLMSNPEVDTAWVYIYKNDVTDNNGNHTKGEIVKDASGSAITETKYTETISDDNKTKLEGIGILESDVELQKFYSTTLGLHTDKTATVTGTDGRTFNLDLEAWYAEGYAPQVGMILDASGSMAFASDIPEAINVKDIIEELKKRGDVDPALVAALEAKLTALAEEQARIESDPNVYPQRDELMGYYSFNKGTGETTTYTLDAKDLDIFGTGTKQNGDTTTTKDGFFTLHWDSTSRVESSKQSDSSKWGSYTSTNRINFSGTVDKDNKSLEFTTTGSATVKIWWAVGGSSGVRNIVIINSDGTTAAGPTENTNSNNNEKFLSTLTLEKGGTYYLGNDGGNNYIYKIEVSVTEEAGTGLENGVTGGASATPVDQQELGSGFSFENSTTTTEPKIENGKLVLNGDQDTAGVLLGTVPNGDFTLSFSITAANSSFTFENPLDILYIGGLTGDGNYLRAIRSGESSSGLVVYQNEAEEKASIPAINAKRHIVVLVYKGGELTYYVYDATNQNTAPTATNAIDIALSGNNIVFNGFENSYDGDDVYIDDVFVYNVALKEDEVTQLYSGIQSQMNTGIDVDAKKAIDPVDWNKVFLSANLVNLILNPHNTDNSRLSASGYSYFVYDPEASTKEYAPLGYWEGSYPQGAKLIGLYSFDNGLLNSVTGNNAYVVAQQTSDGGSIFDPSAADGSSPNISNGKLIINGKSSAGILLDVVPSSGNFTISFTVARPNNTDVSSDQKPVDILYVGGLKPADDGNYLRVIREGRWSADSNGYNSGPGSSMRRAWLTGYQGKAADENYMAKLPDDTVSAVSAFHDGGPHYITYVFQDGKITSYFDGGTELNITGKDADIDQTKELTLDNFNIIFNAFNTGYDGADIQIDDIFVYDTALSQDEVKDLVAAVNATPKFATTAEGDVLGELANPAGAGWYYVTHVGSKGNWESNYTNPDAQTGKRLVGIPYNATYGGFTDNAAAQLPSNSEKKLQTGDTGYEYDPRSVGAHTTTKFYIDQNGYLRCFFNRGNSNLCSYVYELGDREYIKTEALQRALGDFVTKLGDKAPSSEVSAVRFSLPYVPEDDLDMLVLLDWTSDPGESAGVLSLKRGEHGTILGDDGTHSINGQLVQQYNYGLTGSTSTKMGLQSFIENLQPNDDENEDVPKYLIIFTDGKDTDLRDFAPTGGWPGNWGSVAEADYMNDYRDAMLAKGTEKVGSSSNDYNSITNTYLTALQLAQQLKKDGYTIFTVMLTGGPVVEGSEDYAQAHVFLRELAGNSTTDNLDTTSDEYDPNASVDLAAKENYFFSTDKARQNEVSNIMFVDSKGNPIDFAKLNADQQAMVNSAINAGDFGQDTISGIFFSGKTYADLNDAQKKQIDDVIEALNENATDLLTRIFSDEILYSIINELNGYTVMDYIDPRFDLVAGVGVETKDANGNVIKVEAGTNTDCVIHLNANGSVSVVNRNAQTGVETVLAFDLQNGSGAKGMPLGKDENGFYLPLVLSVDSNTDPDARYPRLHYDPDNDMYFLTWVDQTIPGSSVGATTLPVWNAQITVKAKDDFIGGNAILTNGQGANMNWVYHPGDVKNPDTPPRDENNSQYDANDLFGHDASSGTDDMYKSYEKNGATIMERPIDNYPSKGFPRTTANVEMLPLEIGEFQQIIYLGETLTPTELIQDLSDTISNGYYWAEFLRRYARYVAESSDGKDNSGADPVCTDLQDLLEKLVNDNDGEGIYLPYSYLPNAELNTDGTFKAVTNQAGNVGAQQNDIVGLLHYKWVMLDAETNEVIYKDASGNYYTLNANGDHIPYSGYAAPYSGPKQNEEFITQDTRTVKYQLTVTYWPYPDPDDSLWENTDLLNELNQQVSDLEQSISDLKQELDALNPADDDYENQKAAYESQIDDRESEKAECENYIDYIKWCLGEDTQSTGDKLENRDIENRDLITESAYGPGPNNTASPSIDPPKYPRAAVGDAQYNRTVNGTHATYIVRGELAFEMTFNIRELNYLFENVWKNKDEVDYTVNVIANDSPASSWTPEIPDLTITIKEAELVALEAEAKASLDSNGIGTATLYYTNTPYPRVTLTYDKDTETSTVTYYSDPRVFDPEYRNAQGDLLYGDDDEGYARQLPIGTYTLTPDKEKNKADWSTVNMEIGYAPREDYTRDQHHFTDFSSIPNDPTQLQDGKNSKDSVYYLPITEAGTEVDPNYFAYEKGWVANGVVFELGTHKDNNGDRVDRYLADRVGMAKISIKWIELPAAGGQGTRLFQILGIVLLLFAAAIAAFVLNRDSSNNKEKSLLKNKKSKILKEERTCLK